MHIYEVLYDCEPCNIGQIDEAAPRVTRQMRRYGNTLKMQFRCNFGDKKGRLVSNPSKCGIKKNPLKVRAGVKSSRIKKLIRIRKSKFTKSKAASKRLVRINNWLGRK
jgi:hypothetical protein